MQDPLARLEEALGVLVRLRDHPRTHDRLVRRAGVAIDRGPYLVLAAVGDLGPVRISEVARHLDLDVSTASRHVGRLFQAGLLDRSPDTSDQRAVHLALSVRGRAALTELRAARRAALEEALAGWAEADVAALAAALERLTSALAPRPTIPEGAR